MTEDTQNPLAVAVGPFYNEDGVAALLKTTPAEVDARVHAHTLLSVETADGRRIFPVFQFTAHRVSPALLPAISALASSPAWSAALWFVTKNPDLESLTPVEWAAQGRDPQTLLLSARHTAREWQ